MWYQRRKNKFGAKRSHCNSDHYHASKLEAGYCNELLLRKKAGDIKDFSTQVTIPLMGKRKHICDYRIDFVVEMNDGTEEWVETKGMETPEWRLKWKLTEDNFGEDPKVKLVLVK